MMFHFIGIKGSGMSALAQILNDLGFYVQGSDVTHHLYTEDELVKKGITILPFDESNIKEGYTVVVGNAFNDTNVEVKRAKELGVDITTYSDLLGELVSNFDTVSICGTHGKTTTTALISHIMNNVIGVNYLIGDGTGHANKDNLKLVFEACEFKRVFLKYYPSDIILTNIGLEHLDYYKDIEDIKSAFKEFLTHKMGYIIACGDDINVRSIVDEDTILYGFDESNNVVIKNLILDETGSQFDLYYNSNFLGSFKIGLYGKHMVLNAAAAIAYTHLISNIKIEDIKKYIGEFKGAKRRFKTIDIDGTILVDDYAHNPVEIKTVIDSVKQKYPNKKVVSVFFENTYSRTAKFYKDYAEALKLSDHVFVTDILSDREKKEDYPNVGPELIIDLLENAEYLNIDNFIDKNNLNIVKPLKNYKNNVIIFMGCKEVYYLKEKLELCLKEDLC